MTAVQDEFRSLLRGWRTARGKSQLHVALEAGVSQRHLSFVETGRSRPSRETVLALAEALDLPFRERNVLLHAAGYAPHYPETAWNAAELDAVTRAAQRMLRQNEPYPAVLMDRYWNVVAANDSAPRFFGAFLDLHALQAASGRRNLLHLMFDPNGMRPFIADWERVARALLERVAREATGRILDERTRALLAELSAYPGVPAARGGDALDLPMIPLRFIRGDVELSYFSMVSTVGTPQTIAAQELRVECLFPADESTEARHASFMAT